MSGKPAVRSGIPRYPGQITCTASSELLGFLNLDLGCLAVLPAISSDMAQKLVLQHPLQRMPSPSQGFSALVHVCPLIRRFLDLDLEQPRGQIPWLTCSGNGSCQLSMVFQMVCLICGESRTNSLTDLERMHDNPNQAYVACTYLGITGYTDLL